MNPEGTELFKSSPCESRRDGAFQKLQRITIGYSWGRNKEQKPNHYKTPEELKKTFDKVKELNGRLLLNLAPDEDGTIDPYEKESFILFGNVIKNQN